MALHEIEDDLKKAQGTLDHWSANFAKVARAAYDTETEYDLAYQDAIDDYSKPVEGQKAPTVDAVKAKAFIKCEQLYRDYRQAKSDLVIANKLIGIAETTLTAIQTRAGLSKIEAGLTGYRT